MSCWCYAAEISRWRMWETSARSAPVLDARPELLPGSLHAATVKHVEMLVGHGVGMRHIAHLFDVIEDALQNFLAIVEHDGAFAGVVARTPQVIVLMRADRLGQAILGTEEVDRAGLAVVLAEDGGLGADLGWKAVVDARD